MARLGRLLRYDWPLYLVLLLTGWLPDNVVFLRFRGALAGKFLKKCGPTLNLGRNITFHNPSNIELGNFVHISYGCLLMATDKIQVEDEVMFGPYCVLISGNHGRKDGSYRFGPAELLPIRIGKGSWLGAHVTVTAGAELGRGCLAAAGAVVTQSFPEDSMVGGVPARFIKKLER